MVDQRIADVAGRQHGVVAAHQLRACGLSPGAIAHRVRRCRLFPVMRGVFALSPQVGLWGRRHAAVLAVGGATRAVLSHWSAAQAYGLMRTTPHRPHVTIEGTGGRRLAAVHVHRARALGVDDVTEVERLPMTSPARTILDVAGTTATPAQIRRMIREAEYQRLLPAGALAQAVAAHPYHRGGATVRLADPQTAEKALEQTPLEDLLARMLERLPLPEPISQYDLVGASSQRYRADFAWPTLRLLLEADGRASHDRSSSFHTDRERDADLAAVGWMTLRFTKLQLRNAESVADTIVATARTRGWRPPSPVVLAPR